MIQANHVGRLVLLQRLASSCSSSSSSVCSCRALALAKRGCQVRLVQRAMHSHCDDIDSPTTTALRSRCQMSSSSSSKSSSNRRMGGAPSKSLASVASSPALSSSERTRSRSMSASAMSSAAVSSLPSLQSFQNGPQGMVQLHFSRQMLLNRFQVLARRDQLDQTVELVNLVACKTRDDALGSDAKRKEAVNFWVDVMLRVFQMRRFMRDPREFNSSVFSQLRNHYDDAIVSDVAKALIKKCAPKGLFQEGYDLTMLYLELNTTDVNHATSFPTNAVGKLVSKMTTSATGRDLALKLVDALVQAHEKDPHSVSLSPQMLMKVLVLLRQSTSFGIPETPIKISLSKFIELVLHSVNQWTLDPQLASKVRFKSVFGSAIQCCMAREEYDLVVQLYEHMTGVVNVRPDETIYVNVLKALETLKYLEEFKHVYDEMINHAKRAAVMAIQRGQDEDDGNPSFRLGQPTVGTALHFACNQHDGQFLLQVVDDLANKHVAKASKKFIETAAFNHVLDFCLEAQKFQCGRDFYDDFKENTQLDEMSLVGAVRLHRVHEIFELVAESDHQSIPRTVKLYENIMKKCKWEGCLQEARMVMQMMEMEHIEPSLLTYQYLAFLHALHQDVDNLLELLRELQRKKMEPTLPFFESVFDGLTCRNTAGMTPCFEFLSQMMRNGLPVSRALYDALLSCGTDPHSSDLVQAIDLAYQMECDGMSIHEDQMLNLIAAVSCEKDLIHLVQVFELLHQGNVAAEEPFDALVYERLWKRIQLASKNTEKLRSKVQSLALEAGYQLQ